METIKEYFARMGLHDNRQGNKEPKTTIHKEKISRGNKENWKKRHNWTNTHKHDPTTREKALWVLAIIGLIASIYIFLS